MDNFKQKKVFILGGSGFIGQHITKFFLKNKSFVNNFDLNKLKTDINSRSYKFFEFKINGNNNDVKYFKKLINDIGPPDIFINCSYPTTKNYDECSSQLIDVDNINNNLTLHLGSYVSISNLIAKEMVKKKIHGKIILFSSIYGFLAQDLNLYEGTSIKDNLIYPVIKGGIISLTKQLAATFGRKNININCISPGGLKGHSAYNKAKQNSNFMNSYSKKVPLKRMANGEDIISGIAFLSSSNSKYITGHNLIIDGGLSII